MIALLQRVSEASVEVKGQVIGSISHGVLIFLAVMKTDDVTMARRMADKVANYRILSGEDGRPDRSLLDTPGAQALVVSQFTLGAQTSKGRRPDYGETAKGEQAFPIYKGFLAELQALGVPVASGEFGAHMQVRLINDGPVTFLLEVV